MESLYLIKQLFYGYHLDDRELKETKDLLDYLRRELESRINKEVK